MRETTPALFVRSGPSTIAFVPLTRNLSPAAPSLAPSTALGTRNGPRSEVSRHKKRVTSKSIKTFWSFRDSVGIQAYIDRVKGLTDVKILKGGEMVRESIATACCNDIQVMLSAFPYFAGLYKGAVEIIIGIVHLTYLEYVI